MIRVAARLSVAFLVASACSGPPPEPTGPLHRTVAHRGALGFVVIGDFGSGDEAEGSVARAIRAWAGRRPVDVLVTAGDNVYENGSPDRFDEAWARPYGWVRPRGIEVVAALGNHDVRTDDGRPVMDLLGMPNSWYAVEMGPVEFVVMDGNRPGDPDQLSFLRSTLARSEADWQVLVIHQPPFSCGDEHGSSDDVQALVPAMAAGGVDLVVSGHDHTYQRFPPIRGITFIVSGGGGEALDGLTGCSPGTPRPAAAFADAHQFLYARATEDRLTVRSIRVPGSVADTAVLQG